jgi:Na+-transporting NADH:ubiquinone oxidoreductase subunit NqrB
MGASTWPDTKASLNTAAADAAEHPHCCGELLDGNRRQFWPSRSRCSATLWLYSFDPRLMQILFLGILLGAGACLRDFSIKLAQVILTFAASFTCQAFLGRLARQSPISYRSAFITGLSLALLLRSDSLIAHPVAAALAIASKFLIRVRGKHVFNPANFGLVVALVVLPGTWISPGQWGQDVALACWLLLLGNLVVHRARRADISWSFLLLYLGALAIRVAWLGQFTAVWVHQMSNGALLLFAFFMISDPMTSPNHSKARFLHAGLVAFVAYVCQFGLYRNNGFILALFVAAPLVPVWDVIWIAPRFQWMSQGGAKDAQEPRASRAPRNIRVINRSAINSSIQFPGRGLLRILRR